MRQQRFYLGQFYSGGRLFQVYPSAAAACGQCGCPRTEYEKSALVDDLCLHCAGPLNPRLKLTTYANRRGQERVNPDSQHFKCAVVTSSAPAAAGQGNFPKENLKEATTR